MVMTRIATDIRERQDDDREARRDGFFGRGGRRGPRLGWLAHFERIDSHRFGNVLELSLAEIADREIEPSLHLAIGVLGEADRAGLGDAFEASGDINSVAHQVAVTLFDDISEVNANAEDDASILWQADVALDHGVLHFDGAAHGVNHAAEFDDRAVAGALDYAPFVNGDGRVDRPPAPSAVFTQPPPDG